jgi:hypothetical protein
MFALNFYYDYMFALTLANYSATVELQKVHVFITTQISLLLVQCFAFLIMF